MCYLSSLGVHISHHCPSCCTPCCSLPTSEGRLVPENWVFHLFIQAQPLLHHGLHPPDLYSTTVVNTGSAQLCASIIQQECPLWQHRIASYLIPSSKHDRLQRQPRVSSSTMLPSARLQSDHRNSVSTAGALAVACSHSRTSFSLEGKSQPILTSCSC